MCVCLSERESAFTDAFSVLAYVRKKCTQQNGRPIVDTRGGEAGNTIGLKRGVGCHAQLLCYINQVYKALQHPIRYDFSSFVHPTNNKVIFTSFSSLTKKTKPKKIKMMSKFKCALIGAAVLASNVYFAEVRLHQDVFRLSRVQVVN